MMNEAELAKSMEEAIDKDAKNPLPMPPRLTGSTPRGQVAPITSNSPIVRAEQLMTSAQGIVDDLRAFVRQANHDYELQSVKLVQAARTDMAHIEQRLESALLRLREEHESNVSRAEKVIAGYSRITG
jgi:hypothetical protein